MQNIGLELNKLTWLFIFGLVIFGCKDTPREDNPAELTDLLVSPTTISLIYGGTPESQQITATALPEHLTDVAFVWESGDNKVAGVSQTGLVTATGVGSTQITVIANNQRKRIIPVTVSGIVRNRLIYAGLGYARNSVNTVPFRHNSIVTEGNIQYISFFNNNGNVMLGKRNLEDTKFEVNNTGISGFPSDAHNSLSIMTDGAGYLHVAVMTHGGQMYYYRSNTPGSFSLTRQYMIGDTHGSVADLENSVTYIEFYRLPSGDLLLVYRNGGSGNGDMVLNRYTTSTQTWTRVHSRLVYGNNEQSPYWQMYLDAKGTLHLSWVFRYSGDVASNHDMYYAYSTDEGVSWRMKSNGDVYTMPITPSNAEKVWDIPQNSNLINQTSMTADQEGNPYIATYYGTPQVNYMVIFHDGAQWQERRVSNRSTTFSLNGGGTLMIPIARPRIVAQYDGSTGKTKAFYVFRDAERGSKVSMYSTDEISSNNVWNVSDLTDFSVFAWEPSHDTELWKHQGKLHIYVQYADQISGEGLSNHEPMPVYCLEVGLD